MVTSDFTPWSFSPGYSVFLSQQTVKMTINQASSSLLICTCLVPSLLRSLFGGYLSSLLTKVGVKGVLGRGEKALSPFFLPIIPCSCSSDRSRGGACPPPLIFRPNKFARPQVQDSLTYHHVGSRYKSYVAICIFCFPPMWVFRVSSTKF